MGNLKDGPITQEHVKTEKNNISDIIWHLKKGYENYGSELLENQSNIFSFGPIPCLEQNF